jgi:hypothetical protein
VDWCGGAIGIERDLGHQILAPGDTAGKVGGGEGVQKEKALWNKVGAPSSSPPIGGEAGEQQWQDVSAKGQQEELQEEVLR